MLEAYSELEKGFERMINELNLIIMGQYKINQKCLNLNESGGLRPYGYYRSRTIGTHIEFKWRRIKFSYNSNKKGNKRNSTIVKEKPEKKQEVDKKVLASKKM